MKYFTKEVKIALVAIAGVVVLFFGMNFLKGLNIFSSEDNYYVQFSDITGLSSSSPVYADGFKVGVVKDIIYDYSHTEGSKVLIGVDKQLRIPQGSSAAIVSDMLGNVKVNLLLANNPREKVAPGGLIKGMINDGAMDKRDLTTNVLTRLNEERPGWYEGALDFKRVVMIPATGKHEYRDTHFVVQCKAMSGIDCYNRIVDHLRGRVDTRSQFPSAKGKNFHFKYLGMWK